MRPLRVLFCSSAPEKLLHQRATFWFQHAGADLNTMIQEICIADAKPARYRTCPLVSRAVDQTSDTRLYQSARAHRTWLDGRVDIDIYEPVITDLPRGLTKRDDFSVGCGIAVGAGAVSGDGNERVAVDNTSADRHLTATSGLLSRGQRLPHPVLINLSFRGSIH